MHIRNNWLDHIEIYDPTAGLICMISDHKWIAHNGYTLRLRPVSEMGMDEKVKPHTLIIGGEEFFDICLFDPEGDKVCGISAYNEFTKVNYKAVKCQSHLMFLSERVL